MTDQVPEVDEDGLPVITDDDLMALPSMGSTNALFYVIMGLIIYIVLFT